MKKFVMALAVAAMVSMSGCAVQPVQVAGIVKDKRFVPQHETVKHNSTAYNGVVYPGSYRMVVPNQYILVVQTAKGMVEAPVSEYEFRNTPIGRRIDIETSEMVWASDVKKKP